MVGVFWNAVLGNSVMHVLASAHAIDKMHHSFSKGIPICPCLPSLVFFVCLYLLRGRRVTAWKELFFFYLLETKFRLFFLRGVPTLKRVVKSLNCNFGVSIIVSS